MAFPHDNDRQARQSKEKKLKCAGKLGDPDRIKKEENEEHDPDRHEDTVNGNIFGTELPEKSGKGPVTAHGERIT